MSAMVKPRCGVADIINGTSRMRSGSLSHPHGHGHGSLHIVSRYSFFPRTPRWPSTTTRLTLAFHPGTPSTAMSPVRKAFGQWATSAPFTFVEINQEYRKADMTISFQRGDHGDGAPFDVPVDP